MNNNSQTRVTLSILLFKMYTMQQTWCDQVCDNWRRRSTSIYFALLIILAQSLIWKLRSKLKLPFADSTCQVNPVICIFVLPTLTKLRDWFWITYFIYASPLHLTTNFIHAVIVLVGNIKTWSSEWGIELARHLIEMMWEAHHINLKMISLVCWIRDLCLRLVCKVKNLSKIC